MRKFAIVETVTYPNKIKCMINGNAKKELNPIFILAELTEEEIRHLNLVTYSHYNDCATKLCRKINKKLKKVLE